MGSVGFRIRSLGWFVTVAVLSAAVTVMFLNAWRVDAAPGDTDSTFVGITPCRLADTRPAPVRVGAAGSFAAGETKTFSARGSSGGCLIPSDAVGLSINATALGATAQSFLTFWPSGQRPLAASLNPAPGEPPTPNAVTVSLSSAGSFSVYNDAGSVDVVLDVNGYYTRSSLQQLAQRVAALEGSNVAPSPSGFSACITGYGPLSSITSVVGDTTNGLGFEEDVRVDIKCPNGTVETDTVFNVPPGETRGWSVLCDGVFTSGATITTVRI